jgi:UDP-glucose 4-epimerase
MSSASVYGASTEAATTLTAPNPKTFYGISKLKGEKHVERLRDKKQVSIVRCANVYGYSKSMRFDAVINRFVLWARNHGRITINGSGEQGRAFAHIGRVVDFLEKLIFKESWALRYNLSDRNLTVNDIAYALKEILPDLEMLYVDQQLSLRQIQLAEDPNVKALIGAVPASFDEELRGFLDKMA